VLVVDDEPGVLNMFEHVLTSHGFDVETAADGHDAIERIDRHPFDAILTDVTMPDMNGIALLRAVRERDLDVPVILVTGSPSVDTAAQAVEHGALRYLTKPVEIEELVSAVEGAVRLGKMARIKRQALEHLGDAAMQLGDRAGLENAFDAALERLRMVYQPIIGHRSRRVFAYEALLRSDQTRLPHPGAILDAAERLERVHELGRSVRTRIAADLERGERPLIFANLHPRDLLDEELFDPAAPLSKVADHVVLEITERASLEHIGEVQSRVARLRELGYRVAVDDIGAGYAGLNSIAHLEPEFMKIDMVLVRNVHADVTRQKLIGAMVTLCKEMEVQVVAEGIEQAPERDTVARLGCDLLQGYLFAHPSPPFVEPEL
jgi:EAL domain-containing protein (putative c-di-GMP-specific phosphodiesterase class I)